MKEDYKHLMALFCAIIMAVCFPVCSAHAEPQMPGYSGDFGEGGSLHWSITAVDGDRGPQLNISGEGAMPDWESVTETPWYNTSNNVFDAVVINDGVTHIGAHSFEGIRSYCDPELTVSISETVTSIGDYAFSGCKCYSISLRNVEEIGDYAFAGCGLCYLTIPSSVRSVGSNAFAGMKNSFTDPFDPISLTFQGIAPVLGITPFADVIAIAWTPSGDSTWTDTVKQNCGGNLTWYQKGAQTITTGVKFSVSKLYGAKAFYLGAKTTGNGKFTYKSSNADVASVDSKGLVKIKGVGKSTITITASKTSYCQAATKAIKLIVKLKGASLTSVKKAKHKKLKIKWKRNASVTGYQIQYARNKSFKKAKTITIKKNTTTSAKTKKLKRTKTYYVRIRTFKKVLKIRDDDIVYTKTYYSGWSKVKSAKVK